MSENEIENSSEERLEELIQIEKVEDLRAGDDAVFRFEGHYYSGTVYDKDGDLCFAGSVIRWDYGVLSEASEGFVRAFRARKVLPTKPLSIITDVLTVYGDTYSYAVLDGGGTWQAFQPEIEYPVKYQPQSIDSFEDSKEII